MRSGSDVYYKAALDNGQPDGTRRRRHVINDTGDAALPSAVVPHDVVSYP